MKISEIYPAMSKANQNLVKNTLVANLDYILEVGTDEICQMIIDENMDVSYFENVSKKVEEYKLSKIPPDSVF